VVGLQITQKISDGYPDAPASPRLHPFASPLSFVLVYSTLLYPPKASAVNFYEEKIIRKA
jgi:hypothetical protein